MAGKLQAGVIGLGKFGLEFGQTLVKLGHQVIGVDRSEENVKRAQHVFTHVFVADAMDKTALSQIGFGDLTHVLVSVGDSIAASSMIAMYLKEIGVPSVWVKAVHVDHEKLLLKIGVDEVVIPEHLAATQLANRMAMPGLIEKLPFDPNMALTETVIQEWSGKTLRQIDLTNQFNVQAIAVKKVDSDRFQYIPKADEVLRENDILVLIGPIDTLAKLVA